MFISRVLRVGCCALLIAPICWAGTGVPVTVSPGTSTSTLIGDVCPTFNWGAVAGARSHELVVYRLGEEGEEARPVLRETFAGSVSGWTPALDQCLQRGERYAWAVRAMGDTESSEWSPPALFRVAAPTLAELEEALAVVRTHLAKAGGLPETLLGSDGAASAAGKATRAEPAANPDAAGQTGGGRTASAAPNINAGNVGVDTTTPGTVLEVVGALRMGGVPADSAFLVYGSEGESGRPTQDSFRLRYDDNFFATNEDALVIEKTDRNNNPDGGIAFTVSSFDYSDRVSLAIRGNGRVGIGTGVPSTALHIASTNPRLTLEDTDSSGAEQEGFLSFVDSTGTETAWLGFVEDTNFYIRNNIGDIVLRPDGNVGIRTDSPQADLHVAGTAKVDGNLEIGGTIDIGYEIVRSPNTGRLIWAYCPAGKRVLGGGCAGGEDCINESMPISDGSGWACNFGCDFNNADGFAWAICANVE